ncbi:MAG: serine hydrolase domain-containing protein [Micropruina sp.]|uniref:serine hydrolase domain-containing protein n=1 Tax=Micropruina sp. TaxID=2737536 RepID=UPI0039E622B7
MTMPRSTPAAEGVDAGGLLALLDAFETPDHGLHSLMVARHGQVIAEGWWAPYARDRVHLGYSLSKSFTATVLGNLVGRGLIDLDAPVLSYLTDLASVSPKWRRVTVRHCITMTVGHTQDAWEWRGAEPELASILAREPDGEPGQVWAYNQVATYLVAQAIAAVTGEPVTTHVRRLLLDPFGGGPGRAQRTPQGRDLGFSGMHVTTPAILALAQTWLDGGVWQGSRLVPAEYAEAAPRPTPASLASDGTGDWDCGYGFSFWGATHGYRGDGACGQYAIVLPEQDVAVAITSEVETMQDVLDWLWQHLLPAIDVRTDPSADQQLARRLRRLEHRPLSGPGRRPRVRVLRHEASQLPRSYRAVTLATTPGGHHLLTIDHPDGDLVTVVGDGQWLESRWATPAGPELPVVASGAWRRGVFTAQLRLIETPHTIVVDVDPAAGTARLDWRLVPLTGPDPLATASFPI